MAGGRNVLEPNANAPVSVRRANVREGATLTVGGQQSRVERWRWSVVSISGAIHSFAAHHTFIVDVQ
jgi:hypothetical protein